MIIMRIHIQIKMAQMQTTAAELASSVTTANELIMSMACLMTDRWDHGHDHGHHDTALWIRSATVCVRTQTVNSIELH